ncbi:MAG: SCP2 sterol-binding domain-containing protein [Actinomycetota bacterium]|nr:SCP2 sterol-binding domain-containing protein [Actinomycetota bacterium]
MRAGGDPDACRGVRGTIAFKVDDEQFRIELDDGSVAVVEGEPPDPTDLTVTCDHFTDAGIGYRVLTIEDASALGALRLEGDRTLLVCFEVLQFPPYPAMETVLGRQGT